MSNKVARIQKYLKKLHNKKSNLIDSVKKNVAFNYKLINLDWNLIMQIRLI